MNIFKIASNLVNNLMSFIEKFGKNLTYDDIKRHKNVQLFLLYGKYVFGETVRGGLSSSLLRFKYYFCY